jgi:AraC-like DNA-binding protein
MTIARAPQAALRPFVELLWASGGNGTPSSSGAAAPLADAHTPLDDVWGAAAVVRLRDRLGTAGSASSRLALFEAELAARLPRLRGIDPLVALTLMRLRAGSPVAAVVREAGYSHRHVTQTFRDQVGLGPKTYGRLLRFGRALDRIASEPAIDWADLAAAEGYADQAHLTREFRAIAGLTPGQYRRRAPAAPRHVPV